MSSSNPTDSRKNQAQIADIMRRVRDTLRTTEFALETMEREPPGERRIAAMRNIVVFGRAVTNVLQNLRSVAPDFDNWYKPWVDEMAGDPLLKYLYKLRSEILKQGKPSTAVSGYIHSFNTATDLPPKPPHAIGFIIGDEYGGTGWRVELPDGTIEMVYTQLPENQARVWISFQNLPTTHLGKPIGDNTIENVCQLYVDYLRRLLAAAESQFGSPR